MNDRKLFWLGFCGGIIRIFGILALLLTGYLAFSSILTGDWRPVILMFPLPSLLYPFGWALEAIAEIGNKVNKMAEGSETNTNENVQQDKIATL